MSAPTKPKPPNVSRLSFRDLEGQARTRILGLERADFSRIDLTFAQSLVDFLAGHTHRFSVPCRYLAPADWPRWKDAVPPGTPPPPIRVMLTYTIGIAYNPKIVGPGMAPAVARAYRSVAQLRTGDPNNSLRFLQRHEGGHGLTLWHREATRARVVHVQRMIQDLWNRLGTAEITRLFGAYAATVIRDGQGRQVPATELFAEMFGIYDLAPNRFPKAHLSWMVEAVETLEGRRGL